MTVTEGITVSPSIVGRIIQAEGKVLLKRKTWSEYHPTFVGADLYFDDLIKPATGARVVIQCADCINISRPLPTGEISSVHTYCPPQSVSVSRRSGNIIAPRGEINPLIPYIISPRRTLLLNSRPTLRWNGVSGAINYNVSLRNQKRLIWQTEVQGTEVRYTGEPPLQPGVEYLLIVETDTGASSREEGIIGALKFKLLNETDAQQVQTDVQQLAKQELTGEAKVLSLANLYSKYGLISEAIEMLEALAKNESQTATVYCSLGILYREVGLILWAEAGYLKAFELAASVGDIEGQAEVAVGLGDVYDALNNLQEGIRWFTQARDIYETLGDTQRARKLEEKLAELNPEREGA